MSPAAARSRLLKVAWKRATTALKRNSLEKGLSTSQEILLSGISNLCLISARGGNSRSHWCKEIIKMKTKKQTNCKWQAYLLIIWKARESATYCSSHGQLRLTWVDWFLHLLKGSSQQRCIWWKVTLCSFVVFCFILNNADTWLASVFKEEQQNGEGGRRITPMFTRLVFNKLTLATFQR